MAIELIFTPLGRPASLQLAEKIRQAQNQDPLAAVTVVVASNQAGLTIRRLIGTGQLQERAADKAPHLAGIANVSFETPFELAVRLGGRRFDGRKAASKPLIHAGVVKALKGRPSSFSTVENYYSTQSALASAVGTLAELDPATLEAISSSGGDGSIEAELVELYRDTRQVLSNYSFEYDVAQAVSSIPDLSSALAPLGKLIWHLPEPVSDASIKMMGAVLNAADSPTVIVAKTGNPKVDDLALSVLKRSKLDLDAALVTGGEIAPSEVLASETAPSELAASETAPSELAASETAPSEPVARNLIWAPDADQEVRAAVREIAQLLENGVRAERIGLFYTTSQPYGPLVEQHLAASEFAHNGPSNSTLASSVAGRVTLRALEFKSDRSAESLLGFIATAPIRLKDGFIRHRNWERIVRAAGIFGEWPDWSERLNRFIEVLEQTEARNDSHARRIGFDIEDSHKILAFVQTLFSGVEKIERSQGWAKKSQSTRELLVELFGPFTALNTWPKKELDALEEIEKLLDNLEVLDELTDNAENTKAEPNFNVFKNALATGLDIKRGRDSKFGHGVRYGSLAEASSADLDAVFILGCCEGSAPRSVPIDALITQRSAKASQGAIADSETLRNLHHLQFFNALCSAPEDKRWLLIAETELGSSRELHPSRWVLPSLGELPQTPEPKANTENDLRSGDQRSIKPVCHRLPVHAQAITQASYFASISERDCAALLAAKRCKEDLYSHELSPLAAAGMAMREARASNRFTKYDGNLAGVEIDAVCSQVLSSSRLEKWVQCGFSYLFDYVLGLKPLDEDEESSTISNLDKGSLVHKIFEDVIQYGIDNGLEPQESWHKYDTEMAAIAQQHFDSYQQRGLTGRPLIWRHYKQALFETVKNVLEKDDSTRMSASLRPLFVEYKFGDKEPLEIDIGNSRVLKFRGLVDRVDISATKAGSYVLTDYKTADPKKYEAIDSETPTDLGLRLQLGIYAEAAFQNLGAESVNTRYQMTREECPHFGYNVSSKHRQHLRASLAAIVEAIEAGVFFGSHPDPSSRNKSDYHMCNYCEYQRLLPSDVADYCERKKDDPALALRHAIAEIKLEDFDLANITSAPHTTDRRSDTAEVGNTDSVNGTGLGGQEI